MVSQHALQVSRPTPRVEVEGVSRPTPKGGSPGPHLGGLQANTREGVARPTPVGVSRHTPRGHPSMH